MINFSECDRRRKGYSGANGDKIAVIYNNELYMLKFPPSAKINKEMSYTNGVLSEYIGSHIFNILGIKAQETLIGIYDTGKKIKEVVACKDFTDLANGISLLDFASLKNQIIDSERHGFGTDLLDILQTIASQSVMDPVDLEDHFWKIFVVDELIANPDRHNGNWGFLYNAKTDTLTLAPIFDCGSSLYPQADEDIMRRCLSNDEEVKRRIYGIMNSAIQYEGKRINYFNFNEREMQNYPGYIHALLTMAPLINQRWDQICDTVKNTPEIADIQRDFLLLMLSRRKELLIDRAYEKATELTHCEIQNTEINQYDLEENPADNTGFDPADDE